VNVCRQCEKAACAETCPEEAIRRSDDGSYLEVDDTLCTRCEACVTACPFDAVHFDSAVDRVMKCDTCEGDPICVQVCPTGTLEWVETRSEGSGARDP